MFALFHRSLFHRSLSHYSAGNGPNRCRIHPGAMISVVLLLFLVASSALASDLFHTSERQQDWQVSDKATDSEVADVVLAPEARRMLQSGEPVRFVLDGQRYLAEAASAQNRGLGFLWVGQSRPQVDSKPLGFPSVDDRQSPRIAAFYVDAEQRFYGAVHTAGGVSWLWPSPDGGTKLIREKAGNATTCSVEDRGPMRWNDPATPPAVRWRRPRRHEQSRTRHAACADRRW